ncbi:MAG: peroxidase-related enzyme [Chthonomonadaceae bacterium]|nr:peroxidase-related enzyme [Chthonomonadaceae bacterium]
MTWIKTIPISQGDALLRKAVEEQDALYPSDYSVQVPGLPPDDYAGIVAAHSLIPEALKHAFATFGACMSPDLPLNRRQHELIATAVSQANCTFYCSTAHREFLRRATHDDALVEAMKTDYRTAPLSEAERVMVEYAMQITQDATQISRETHARLHEVGFDDVAILQITMIASWFNYINRMADALGVGRD